MTITINTLYNMKQRQEKIVCLTAYDASFTILLEQAGVEVILIGDSLGMVIHGKDSTVSVTMRDMLYHTTHVATASNTALLIADMPFMSYATIPQALQNAAKLMRAGAHMIKLEGGKQQLATVEQLSAAGIPVCAHIGLQPQLIHKMGGYRVQGREEQAAQQMIDDALRLQQAGADILLVECIPAHLAKTLQQMLDIPLIGIGAGIDCDGQILVLYDVLGITSGKVPRFAMNFMQSEHSILAALEAYTVAVKQGVFPELRHGFK